jgi:hypothetical protein
MVWCGQYGKANGASRRSIQRKDKPSMCANMPRATLADADVSSELFNILPASRLNIKVTGGAAQQQPKRHTKLKRTVSRSLTLIRRGSIKLPAMIKAEC